MMSYIALRFNIYLSFQWDLVASFSSGLTFHRRGSAKIFQFVCVPLFALLRIHREIALAIRDTREPLNGRSGQPGLPHSALPEYIRAHLSYLIKP